VHAGEKDHARPGWTTSIRRHESPWKSQSEWQTTEINGESTSMLWPTLWSRTAKKQNRTEQNRKLSFATITLKSGRLESNGKINSYRSYAIYRKVTLPMTTSVLNAPNHSQFYVWFLLHAFETAEATVFLSNPRQAMSSSSHEFTNNPGVSVGQVTCTFWSPIISLEYVKLDSVINQQQWSVASLSHSACNFVYNTKTVAQGVARFYLRQLTLVSTTFNVT